MNHSLYLGDPRENMLRYLAQITTAVATMEERLSTMGLREISQVIQNMYSYASQVTIVAGRISRIQSDGRFVGPADKLERIVQKLSIWQIELNNCDVSADLVNGLDILAEITAAALAVQELLDS